MGFFFSVGDLCMNYELFLKTMTWGRGEGHGKDTVSDNARFPNLIKSYQSILNILLISHHQKKKKNHRFSPSLEKKSSQTCELLFQSDNREHF